MLSERRSASKERMEDMVSEVGAPRERMKEWKSSRYALYN